MPFRAVSRETSTPFGAVLHSNRCGGPSRLGGGPATTLGGESWEYWAAPLPREGLLSHASRRDACLQSPSAFLHNALALAIWHSHSHSRSGPSGETPRRIAPRMSRGGSCVYPRRLGYALHTHQSRDHGGVSHCVLSERWSALILCAWGACTRSSGAGNHPLHCRISARSKARAQLWDCRAVLPIVATKRGRPS